MIIADENVERYWINLLRRMQYEVVSIAETSPGISDTEVVIIAKKHKGILITEDKDFGELVFAHGIDNLSIIFLRYDQPEYSQVENALVDVVNTYVNSETAHFITISKTKIRARKI